MRIATIVGLFCVAGALTGCSGGHNIEFVASNPDSVLLDIRGYPQGDLAVVNSAATQECQVYSRRLAVLESLNVRNDHWFRATYLCKGGAMTADASTGMRHRK